MSVSTTVKKYGIEQAIKFMYKLSLIHISEPTRRS